MTPAEASLQVDLAEYNALRAEIQTFITLQSAFVGLAVAIIAAVFPVAADKPLETRRWIVAATPVPYAILAVLYADVVARIGRAAKYIHTKLQPRLAAQTTCKDTLGWEHYVHKEYPSKLLGYTDKIRYPIFFFPGIGACVASYLMPTGVAVWDICFRIVNPIALIAAFVVALKSEGVIGRIV